PHNPGLHQPGGRSDKGPDWGTRSVSSPRSSSTATSRSRTNTGLFTLGPPILFFLLLTAAWQAAVVCFKVPPFLLPSPLAIAKTPAANLPALLAATGLTAAAAVTGFAASLLVGCLVAFAFSQSVLIRRCCFPYAIFLQTVPIVAIAPLIIIW